MGQTIPAKAVAILQSTMSVSGNTAANTQFVIFFVGFGSLRSENIPVASNLKTLFYAVLPRKGEPP